jgi:predicted DNA-binding WGR domain protein
LGRIGTQGSERVQVFDNEFEARKALEVLARAKRRRGYQDL